MSWQGHGHTGGVRGTVLARTDCPVCGRSTAGGNRNRERTQIQLKPHKRDRGDGGREWCPGGGRAVYWR
jgi:hypothetical protein